VTGASGGVGTALIQHVPHYWRHPYALSQRENKGRFALIKVGAEAVLDRNDNAGFQRQDSAHYRTGKTIDASHGTLWGGEMTEPGLSAA